MSFSTQGGAGAYGPGGYPGGPVRRRTGMGPLSAALLIGGLLGFMWLLELFDQSTGEWLDQYGIHARELDGLPAIFAAPLLHGGIGHLVSNSMPFAVLGFITALSGFARWFGATLISVVVSGVTAWLLTPANTIILGASGLIFGWLTYIITRGLFDRRWSQILIGALVLIFYGGMIWGVLPSQPGISWQAHLGGAIGGVLAARFLHGRRARAMERAR